jgi:hypothetical protein
MTKKQRQQRHPSSCGPMLEVKEFEIEIQIGRIA